MIKPLMTFEQKTNLKEPLLWVDLEMTGLNLNRDQIIEVAAILTNGDLTEMVEGPNEIIKAPDALLDNLDEWCEKTFTESGLKEQCRASKVTLKEAEDLMIDFLKKNDVHEKKVVLAGNSVHVDRQFLLQQMPNLMALLHYRIVDVSTVKELAKRWYPDVAPPQKKLSHRALDDIRESIEELRFWRSRIFS